MGAVLMAVALVAAAYNGYEALRAKCHVQKLMPQVLEQIALRQDQQDVQIPGGVLWVPDSYDGKENAPMPVVTVDGKACIGYLTVPRLNVQLPVLSQWSQENEKIAPSRCDGSVGSRDLAIVAENFRAHFGILDQLQPGDRIMFTDMNGITTVYDVAVIDRVTPTDVQQLLDEPFDLALLTRQRNGNTWIAVYCDLK